MIEDKVVYKFKVPGKNEVSFIVDLVDGEAEKTSPSTWTHLRYNQCPNCPLNSETHRFCPLALRIKDVIEFSADIVSYKKVIVEVLLNDRSVTAETSAQEGLSSLLGLVIAVSGCPRTAFLKPMAYFHVPLATYDETVFRVITSEITRSFLKHRKGESVDWSLQGLQESYEHLHVVNTHIAKRLHALVKEDASLNAIVDLDAFTTHVPAVIEEFLDRLQELYDNGPM